MVNLTIITSNEAPLSFIDLLLDECKLIIKDVTINMNDSCIEVTTNSSTASVIFVERAKQLNVKVIHSNDNQFLIEV